MRLLLDTNAMIWWITDHTRLTAKADRIIRTSGNDLTVSIVSLWELSIKISKGNFTGLGSSIQYIVDELHAQRIDTLPLTLSHIYRLERLDPIHRDPFDRMIIAQALEELIPVVTSDHYFPQYGVNVLW